MILVHDAARPLVSDEVIERVLAPLGEGWDGAVPGLPVADTVKRAPDGTVAETVDRRGLYARRRRRRSSPRRSGALWPPRRGRDRLRGLRRAAGGRVRVVEGDPGW